MEAVSDAPLANETPTHYCQEHGAPFKRYSDLYLPPVRGEPGMRYPQKVCKQSGGVPSV